MTDYRVSSQAYIKLLLHASKYPFSNCHGLLIGEENGPSEFVVTDAIPLFHHQNPLAPIIEASCQIVDAWAQKKNKKIVGYYYAGVHDTGSNPSLDFIGQKIADKIEANCSRACVILVDSQQLNSEENLGIQLLLKDVKRGWVRMDNHLQLEERAPKLFSKALVKQVQEEIVDFDEHYEDLSKDWQNSNLVKLVELNTTL